MNIENYIETQYREINQYLNIEFIDLYKSFSHPKLQEVLSTIHHLFSVNYHRMNDRLPTAEYSAHFWADPSRELLFAINTIRGMQRTLKNTPYSFEIDPYYEKIVQNSEGFLSASGGSELPPHMNKIDIYYTEPILHKKDAVHLSVTQDEQRYANLKLIGEGSYAQVFTYTDSFYNRKFVLKRAKSELSTKEIERFRQEYEQMNILFSPYIVEVFKYDDSKNEYIMEYMDVTLDKYYEKHNSNMTKEDRKGIAGQILRAFKYIHSKGLLHRDISPKNILLKVYDDVKVVKISDFGLVKVPDSTLTTVNTEFKGYFNDPGLVTEGFSNYGILHETYALTRLIYFVLTGKMNVSNIKDKNMRLIIEKGLSTNKDKRFKSVDEIIEALKQL